jgi:hypothetical protein
MDGKQFLKEAKEAYSEHHEVNFANFTVDEFKRSIYHYIGRDGTAINYLYSLLRQKTRAERKQYDVLALHGGRQADVDIVLKRAKEETDSWQAEHQLWFELLVEVVLKYLDEIAVALKEQAEDTAAYKALFGALGKLPSVIGDDRLGPMVDTMIRKYWDAVNARHDLYVYKKMQEVTKELRGKRDDLTSLLSDTIKDATSHVSEIVNSYNGIEKQVLGVLSGCLKDKYVFWNEDDEWSKIMRIDDVTLDKYGHCEVFLHGPCVAPLRWDFRDECKYANGMFWSRLTDLSKGLSELCIVEWDDLLGYVEKHAPFAMELIKQLGKEYKLQ